MNKPAIAIIEDEIPAARLLHSMIARLRPEWDITVIPGSVEEATEWFATPPHPDLLFLDIQLADGNSFDFLSAAHPSSTIIFTTAYDQYAVRAFTVNSIDYILKPIDEQRLQEAIDKYEHLQQCSNPRPDDYLATLLDALQSKEKQYRTRFLIYRADRFWSLQVSDIAYFYSENRVTFAVTKQGREHIVDFSLDKLSEQLNPDYFFRTNRQTLVGIEAIRKIEPYFQNKVVVDVIPPFKDKILVSKEKIASFKVWLNY